MDERSAVFSKVFEYEVLEAENKVKFYRGLLGMPPVEDNANCAKEIESLKSQLQEKIVKNVRLLQQAAQQKSENEVLHRKVNDLGHKFSQARLECDKLRNELKATREEFSAYLNKNVKPAAMFKNLTKAELYDEILKNANDCLVGSVIGIKHEPNDLEPDGMFYFLRITKDEAYRIDMGGYAHLEVWED